jgi:hypothetical protein
VIAKLGLGPGSLIETIAGPKHWTAVTFGSKQKYGLMDKVARRTVMMLQQYSDFYSVSDPVNPYLATWFRIRNSVLRIRGSGSVGNIRILAILSKNQRNFRNFNDLLLTVFDNIFFRWPQKCPGSIWSSNN